MAPRRCFQTRNHYARAHVELTFRAAKMVEANLIINRAWVMTKPGDVDYFTRVRCYQLLLSKFPQGTVKLALLPLAIADGGPREAVWHALIARTTVALTSSSAAITPAPAAILETRKPFYGPTKPRSVQKHQADIAYRWSVSA